MARDGVISDVTKLATAISTGNFAVHFYASAFVADPPNSWVIGRGPMTSDRVTAVAVVVTNLALSNVTKDGAIVVAAICPTWDGWRKSG